MNESCEHIRSLFYDYLDGSLSDEDERKVIGHIEECEACRAELKKEKELASMLESMPHESAPASLRANVLRQLRNEQAEEAGRLPADTKKIPAVVKFVPLAFAAAAILIVALGIHIVTRPGFMDKTGKSAGKARSEKPATTRREEFADTGEKMTAATEGIAEKPVYRDDATPSPAAPAFASSSAGTRTSRDEALEESPSVPASRPGIMAEAPPPAQKTVTLQDRLKERNMPHRKMSYKPNEIPSLLEKAGALNIEKIKAENPKETRFSFFMTRPQLYSFTRETKLYTNLSVASVKPVSEDDLRKFSRVAGMVMDSEETITDQRPDDYVEKDRITQSAPETVSSEVSRAKKPSESLKSEAQTTTPEPSPTPADLFQIEIIITETK